MKEKPRGVRCWDVVQVSGVLERASRSKHAHGRSNSAWVCMELHENVAWGVETVGFMSEREEMFESLI